jgi:hypothetical protein
MKYFISITINGTEAELGISQSEWDHKLWMLGGVSEIK